MQSATKSPTKQHLVSTLFVPKYLMFDFFIFTLITRLIQNNFIFKI
jgi:hypothetical protein